ncbi:bifunctional 2-C-methyl-D-erythritol 4-phosphate cytidylyltransferase/2-C-methyl-D-erythritol 2,4-cyclodiphosphate synthase [Sphingopyxis sp. GW247-27LB]|uniref:bifunctional 2-C-methyl-D-erythritol 4-phosphate cytidylyltransferase/2-C-methyl-D-erythritol 2,4-cyclodiphosphate synthase n=1 Tax=Sphingopyxis sp. GW247-27LB TaxID=2012632 RepID=UPI000BA5CB96|nr:bifunctional 2-C-methyl-D-erythritol 4-phosphate cytidylyltransferase/2-C-methyl-D-erythritol 2,4-cyclodiphosphate synthase [Sphingopyxis sp. GW247-27LB]PAL19418.1 bifunctional 2-C-methyl-D-erythritol 4-phosphate cytidylyltransferase/2-C-methyl-D-erythritol 2,4-cyclodiphosphate synthase [Sphingopyxis sp. GW247-27LB]
MTESAPSPAPRVAVILLAGGRGTRAGFARPKQLEPLGGKPVLRWSLDALAAHPRVSGGALIAGDDVMAAALPLPEGWISASPGVERQQSVANGLAALVDWEDEALVLVHDAARPGVTAEVIDRLLAALDSAEAAIPTLPVPDTLVRQAGDEAGDVVDRGALARVQTPQAFRLGTLRLAHAAAAGETATDDAQLVRRLGVPVAAVAGDARLHKLTYAEDRAILEGLLEAKAMRRTAVGMGYDVHRLVAGKPLWIGGLEIEHSHGLEGHSDADVALHALTDAILGALGDGDIGTHFPPSDPEWRGAASWRFLDFAARRVEEAGGRIDHVDLTIIAEAPKIGPHRDRVRARIAEILSVRLERVSVKATTTERLGFTGRREGIAAQAIATLSLPEN